MHQIQQGDVAHTEADVTDLYKNLSYHPNTQVQKGIEMFIVCYKSYIKGKGF